MSLHVVPKSETRYLSCTETAELLRKALKEAFPKVKFGVRSKRYSGGASISVRWTDGPRTARVQAITDRFEGAAMDASTDCKIYRTSLLEGQKVHFGSDFIFAYRDISRQEEKVAEAATLIRQRCHLDEQERFGSLHLSELARMLVRDHDAEEPIEQAFRRVVLHESQG